MAKFCLQPGSFDGVFCTVDTFRHLLTAREAGRHLQSVAVALKPGGLYVLGLHLLPGSGMDTGVVRWQMTRGLLTVHVTMTVLDVDRRKRRETIRVNLRAETGTTTRRYRSVYRLRTYTLGQFHDLLRRCDAFEITDVCDHGYNRDQPIALDRDAEDVVVCLRKK